MHFSLAQGIGRWTSSTARMIRSRHAAAEGQHEDRDRPQPSTFRRQDDAQDRGWVSINPARVQVSVRRRSIEDEIGVHLAPRSPDEDLQLPVKNARLVVFDAMTVIIAAA